MFGRATVTIALFSMWAAIVLPVAAKHMYTDVPARCTAKTADVAVPGHAMSVLPADEGCTLYVSVSGKGAPLPDGSKPRNGVAVFAVHNGVLIRHGFLPLNDEPAQMALSKDGRTLYIADNVAGIVEAGVTRTGELQLKQYILKNLHGGFFQIALSPRGDVLYGGAMKMDRVVAIPVADPSRTMMLPTDHFPVGLALSGDGRFLYVSNTVAIDPAQPKFHRVTCTYNTDPTRLAVTLNEGTLEVFDTQAVLRGDRTPVARVRAACAPVRVALDEARNMVWMTARESDLLLGYPIADVLHASKTQPLLVHTGKSPVGLAIAGRDRLLVGDSARFMAHQSNQKVELFALPQARRLQLANVGTFPRDIAIDASGKIAYVANFGSCTVSVIRIL